jgi:DNA-binding MarR family transcriptional regulator
LFYNQRRRGSAGGIQVSGNNRTGVINWMLAENDGAVRMAEGLRVIDFFETIKLGEGYITMSNSGYKNDMSFDERVMMAIVRLAERFKKESSLYLKDYNITFPQYNVLRVLDASKNGQNTMKNVNRIMLVSSANMTGITQRLEKVGLINRKNAPEDDRLKYLEITPKGRQVLKNISIKKDQVVNKYFLKYSNEKKSEILSLLKEILSNKN